MTFIVVMRANGVSELEFFLHFSVRKEPFPACSRVMTFYCSYASERSERALKFLPFLVQKEPLPASSRADDIDCSYASERSERA